MRKKTLLHRKGIVLFDFHVSEANDNFRNLNDVPKLICGC